MDEDDLLNKINIIHPDNDPIFGKGSSPRPAAQVPDKAARYTSPNDILKSRQNAPISSDHREQYDQYLKKQAEELEQKAEYAKLSTIPRSKRAAYLQKLKEQKERQKQKDQTESMDIDEDDVLENDGDEDEVPLIVTKRNNSKTSTITNLDIPQVATTSTVTINRDNDESEDFPPYPTKSSLVKKTKRRRTASESPSSSSRSRSRPRRSVASQSPYGYRDERPSQGKGRIDELDDEEKEAVEISNDNDLGVLGADKADAIRKITQLSNGDGCDEDDDSSESRSNSTPPLPHSNLISKRKQKRGVPEGDYHHLHVKRVLDSGGDVSNQDINRAINELEEFSSVSIAVRNNPNYQLLQQRQQQQQQQQQQQRQQPQPAQVVAQRGAGGFNLHHQQHNANNEECFPCHSYKYIIFNVSGTAWIENVLDVAGVKMGHRFTAVLNELENFYLNLCIAARRMNVILPQMGLAKWSDHLLYHAPTPEAIKWKMLNQYQAMFDVVYENSMIKWNLNGRDRVKEIHEKIKGVMALGNHILKWTAFDSSAANPRSRYILSTDHTGKYIKRPSIDVENDPTVAPLGFNAALDNHSMLYHMYKTFGPTTSSITR